MVSKVLHTSCIVLLLVLATIMCVNSVRALNSGYEKIEFTITTVQTDITTGKSTVSVETVKDDVLIMPKNQMVTSNLCRVGDVVELWYNAESNTIVQHFMTHIVMNFVGAGLALVCVAVTWPRKDKAQSNKVKTTK